MDMIPFTTLSEFDRLMARFQTVLIDYPGHTACPDLYNAVLSHAEESPEDTETLETLVDAFSQCARGMHADDPIHPVRTPDTGSALGIMAGIGLIAIGGWFLVKRK